MARKRKSLGQQGNSERHQMTWKQLLGAAAFIRGFKEVRAGKPFDYDRPPSDGWSYERGRLFGVVRSMGKALRITALFKSDAEANAYMERNKDEGVIAEIDGVIFLANLHDKGEKIGA